MNYRKVSDDKYVISIAPGEEIIEQLNAFLAKESIINAYFFGIGAVRSLELGHYKVSNKKYSSRKIDEPLEISNLIGNVFLFEGKPLIHVHITVANDKFETFSGHMAKAVVSAACEIVLMKLDSDIKRKYSEEIGLNLLDI